MRFFWGELLLVAAMSIGGNAVHAVLNAPPRLAVVAAIVATFPPIALLAATHGVGLLVRARTHATFAYWAVVLLTGAIAAVAFRLSFDALKALATQVGMSEQLAFLFPLIIDGAIGQATVALLVLARTPRTSTDPDVRSSDVAVRSPEPVRTMSVREVHTETRSTSTELTARRPSPELGPAEFVEIDDASHIERDDTGARTDQWAAVAEAICNADPFGRRDPGKVAAILRLRHEGGWSHARIAEHVELSSSAVTRTLTAAQEYTTGDPQ